MNTLITIKGNIVDNRKVLLDYSRGELDVAFWFSLIFNDEVYLVPRVVYPQNISTLDFIIKGEKWDLKEIYGNGNNTIDRTIQDKKHQSNNFINDITNSNVNEFDVIASIFKIYNSKYRICINKIILKKMIN